MTPAYSMYAGRVLFMTQMANIVFHVYETWLYDFVIEIL